MDEEELMRLAGLIEDEAPSAALLDAKARSLGEEIEQLKNLAAEQRPEPLTREQITELLRGQIKERTEESKLRDWWHEWEGGHAARNGVVIQTRLHEGDLLGVMGGGDPWPYNFIHIDFAAPPLPSVEKDNDDDFV